MQVDYLILADAVAVANGKHYIHGGGWDTLFVASFPALHPALAAAVRLRIPWQETNQQLALEVDIVAEDGEQGSILAEPLRGVVSALRPPNVSPDSDLLMHFAFGFTDLKLENPGRYTVIVRVDGQPLAESRFNAIAAPEQAG